jgi:hypothetical protein
MKKLFVFLMVAGLILAGGGMASVLAQPVYNLRAEVKWGYEASDFQLRYIDRDGDGKFSLDELLGFSGVWWYPNTYTQILGVPSDTTDSPFTDGPHWSSNPSFWSWWWFGAPGTNGIYIRPNAWTYSQAPASEIFVSVPGKMILSDAEGDFNLKNCDPASEESRLIPCSLPPGVLPDLPGYLDIRQAGITQIGRQMVDLTINVYEPIPAVPDYLFVSYFWQFEGGCVPPVPGTEPSPGDKAGIHVTYSCIDGECKWRATWLEITSCSPREFSLGDPAPFVFTENGIRVRVGLGDLLTAIDTHGQFLWHTGVRLVPFGSPVFINSVAVDNAPNVFAFREPFPTSPPFGWTPEGPVAWEPR